MVRMQTKTGQRQSAQTEQSSARVQPALAGHKPGPLGNAGVLLSLQRSHGNRYVQRLLNNTLMQRECGCGAACPDCGHAQAEELDRPSLQQKSATLPAFVQAKLTVSQPGDSYEQEADRVADEVMRMPEPVMNPNPVRSTPPPVISRYPVPGGRGKLGRQAEATDQPVEEEQPTVDTLLSFKEIPGASHDIESGLESRIRQIQGRGEPLSTDLRAFFEPRFGVDFSSVRIHTDSAAADTAHRVQARAYTLGTDIAFAQGEFQKDSPESRKLLAHELTHVVQQGDQVRTLMRACDCTAKGRSAPTSAQNTFLSGVFPNLKKDDYCVTAPEEPSYNCIAWTIGNTSKWVWGDVDKAGNNNGTVEISDFDAFYKANGGLTPVVGSTPSNAKVALYAVGSKPTHGAVKTGTGSCSFESKLGKYVRIAHDPTQLEGGSLYGNIDRYYE
jgi:hypothetical protein